MRVEGPPAVRAARAVRSLWPLVFALGIAITFATFRVHSPVPALRAAPWTLLAPLALVVGLGGVLFYTIKRQPRRVFAASLLFLGGMIASAAVTLFPYLLPGYPSPQSGLSIYTVPVLPGAFDAILPVAIVGLVIVGAYRMFVARRIAAGERGGARGLGG